MKRDLWIVVFVTVYLLVYTVLTVGGADTRIVIAMYLFSPVLLIFMVYNVLKYGVPPKTELGEDEEWGYADKEKKDLGTF